MDSPGGLRSAGRLRPGGNGGQCRCAGVLVGTFATGTPISRGPRCGPTPRSVTRSGLWWPMPVAHNSDPGYSPLGGAGYPVCIRVARHWRLPAADARHRTDHRLRRLQGQGNAIHCGTGGDRCGGHPCLIERRRYPDPALPTIGAFDHEIAVVKRPAGDVFADLTSEYSPFGTLPSPDAAEFALRGRSGWNH